MNIAERIDQAEVQQLDCRARADQTLTLTFHFSDDPNQDTSTSAVPATASPQDLEDALEALAVLEEVTVRAPPGMGAICDATGAGPNVVEITFDSVGGKTGDMHAMSVAVEGGAECPARQDFAEHFHTLEWGTKTLTDPQLRRSDLSAFVLESRAHYL